MPRWVDEDDHDEDNDDRWQAEADDDDELPEGVYPDDDEEPTLSCPHCHREIHEDALHCPHCEQYLSAEDTPSQRKPWWIIIGAILCLFVAILWALGH